MSKREKRLTKKERKALDTHTHEHNEQHIHCIACGRHLDGGEFQTGTAQFIICQHGSQFPSCKACSALSTMLIEEHDRTGQPVKSAQMWH